MRVAAIVAFDRPVIAAARGVIAGTWPMFALAADVVLGDDATMIMFSHRHVGSIPMAEWRVAARLLPTGTASFPACIEASATEEEVP